MKTHMISLYFISCSLRKKINVAQNEKKKTHFVFQKYATSSKIIILAVFHKGSAANYERVIYVKTLEFKDVSIMNKSDALFSAHYSDIADSFTQDLEYKFRRLGQQIEFMRDNPEKADEIVELVKEEIKHCQIFAKYAFHIQDGRMQVEDLVEKNLIQNVYTKNG